MLSIIIVNYNSKDYLVKCLLSLKQHLKDKSFEVIIANNSQEIIDFSPSEFPFVKKIIYNQGNLGFAAANNLAASFASGEYLLFLNPDTQIFNDSIFLMLKFMKKNPAIKIIGPKLISMPEKKVQPWTCGKKTSLWNILFKNTFGKPWNKKIPQKVDWVSGAALMMEKNIFKRLDGFDEKFFMYFEDQDLCLRTKKLSDKFKVIFFPMAKVLHYSGQSWQNDKISQKRAYYTAQNYFFQKHHSRFACWFLKILKKSLGIVDSHGHARGTLDNKLS